MESLYWNLVTLPEFWWFRFHKQQLNHWASYTCDAHTCGARLLAYRPEERPWQGDYHEIDVVPTDSLTHLPLVPHICVSEFESALVKIMACRLLGVKPLTETNDDLLSIAASRTNFSEIRIKIQNFHSWKCNWKCCLHFVRGGGGGGGGGFNSLKPTYMRQ